jgi:dsDNA-binding SOS-regulon protein
MAKTLKDILEVAKPVSPADKAFVAKHTIKKTPDADKNGDDVFNATKTKTYKRSPTHGYDNGADEKVYEEHAYSANCTCSDCKRKRSMKKMSEGAKSLSDILEKTLTSNEKSKREEIAMAIKRENPSMPMGKKMAIATAQAKKVAEETDLDEAMKYATVDPKQVKSVLAAHRATGEAARHMGNGKIAYSGKTLVKEELENITEEELMNLDEAVAKDHYDMHHKRAMSALNDIGKHLMKQKGMCDKSDNKWAHQDNAWAMKDMSRQLEDMVQNSAQRTENMMPIPTPKDSIRGY